MDQLSREQLDLLAGEQAILSGAVSEAELEQVVELVAGVDVAYSGCVAYSAAVVMDEGFEVVEVSTAETRVDFPYIPGFLSYREAPPSIKAVRGLSEFDVLMVNGHGLAHPRGFGLASHVGVRLGRPTIGVARQLLFGEPREAGAEETLIMLGERVIGAKMTAPTGSPVYVSVGHLITLESCMEIVEHFFLDHSLPEPIMAAHRFANEASKPR